MNISDFTTKDIERFWSKVNIPDDSGACWEWSAYIGSSGYGHFHLRLKPIGAHRVAYLLTNGNIPEGMFVCHHCDNKKCVNPKHLFLGTQADNMTDKNNKSRQARGEIQGSHKLTDKDIIEIRERYTGEWGDKARLGREYHVTPEQIAHIVNGDHWKHLPNTSYKPTKDIRYKLTEAQIREIRKEYTGKYGQKATLAKKYGVSFRHIADIVEYKAWKHLDNDKPLRE